MVMGRSRIRSNSEKISPLKDGLEKNHPRVVFCWKVQLSSRVNPYLAVNTIENIENHRIMKFKFFLYTALLLFGSFAFTSCEREEDETPMNDPIEGALDDALSSLLKRASESGTSSTAIDCIDFVYPITFFIYNGNQEQTGTERVTNDNELFAFLSGLDEDTTVAINYPISVVLKDGTIVEVTDNAQLLALISECEANDGNEIPQNFQQLLVDGVWYVAYFFDDQDETDDLAGYEFDFAPNNTAQATLGNNTVNGTWNLSNDNIPDLELFFGTADPLDELDEDWDIIEATNEVIRLKNISGGDGSIDFLTLDRNPTTGGGTGTSDFTNALIEGSWYVNLLNDDGNDETCDYVAYQFTFNSNETVTAVSPNRTVNGNWAATTTGGTIEISLQFETTGADDPFDDLNDDDWNVENFSNQLIELKDISGGNGGTDLLNFGREPATGCGAGGNALAEILIDGFWYVNLSEEDGNDQTCDYEEYQFSFSANNTVTASAPSNTVIGTWTVTGAGSDLDLNLSFQTSGQNDPFEDLNDDWDVEAFGTASIQLKDVSGGNGGTDLLTFGRNPVSGCGTTGGGQVGELTDILLNGQWFIASYIDDGDDQTAIFANYVFSFNSNGTATANNGSNNVTGTWSVILDDDELKVVLDFGTSFPLEELEDDWDVSSYTTIRVELFDVSGGNGGTDTLIFENL
jgi:heat shock protein HslJ